MDEQERGPRECVNEERVSRWMNGCILGSGSSQLICHPSPPLSGNPRHRQTADIEFQISYKLTPLFFFRIRMQKIVTSLIKIIQGARCTFFVSSLTV